MSTALHLPLAASPLAIAPGDYVLDVCASTSGSLIVAATSGGGVVGVNVGGAAAAVAPVGRHGGGVSAVCLDEGRGLVLSASLDGTVACWDPRASPGGGPAASFTAGQPLHSVVPVSTYIAAGADGRVCLWDVRTGRRAGSFDDTHDGDVTALAAPASTPAVRAPLISAGVDGLIAVWDLGAGVLEDDAFMTALNGGTSIARLGATPHGQLWATTHVEGLVLWDWAAACDEEDEAGGVGPLAAVDDVRPGGGGKGGAADDGSFPGAAVGCAVVGGDGGAPPRLLLGLAPPGEAGALALHGVGPPPARGGPPALGPAQAVLRGGHAEAVRAWAWLGDAPGSALAAATGGEDGRLALWRRPPGGGGGGGSGSGGGPATPAPAAAMAMHAGAPSPTPSTGGGGGGDARGGLRAGSVRRGRTPGGD